MDAALRFSSIHEVESGRLIVTDGRGALVTARSPAEVGGITLVSCYYQERAALISISNGAACAAERSGAIAVNRPHIDSHEVFRMVPVEGDIFSLKSAHNRYVRPTADGMFDAAGGNLNTAAKFRLGDSVSESETIKALLAFNKMARLINYHPDYTEREVARFAAAARQKIVNKEPLLVLVGPGPNVRSDALHISTGVSPNLMKGGWLQENYDKYFAFPADTNWGIPNSCVDFIYHEDVFEHLDQKAQIKLLAEGYRVLRKGGIHRINTPCLRDSMRTHSDFALGAKGVYEAEWDRWGHTFLATQDILKDYASMIGYDRCAFSVPNFSLSPLFHGDTRPSGDRHAMFGNAIVELVK